MLRLLIIVITLLFQKCIRSEIEYELSVSVDNTKTIVMKFCNTIRTVDIIADYLILNGYHEKFKPKLDVVTTILSKVCTDTVLCGDISDGSDGSVDMIRNILSVEKPIMEV